MSRYKIVGNEKIEMTAEEIATQDAEWQAEKDLKPQKQLEQIRKIRNKKLSETDYLALSDATLSDEMKEYRQRLRNIPQDFSEADYDDLLEKKKDVGFKHSIWSKP